MLFRYLAHKSSDLSILVDFQQSNPKCKIFLTRAKAIEWLMGIRLSLAPCTSSICFPVNRLKKELNYQIYKHFDLATPSRLAASQAGQLLEEFGFPMSCSAVIGSATGHYHNIMARSCQCQIMSLSFSNNFVSLFGVLVQTNKSGAIWRQLQLPCLFDCYICCLLALWKTSI